MTRLSVNINKIATLRNARGHNMPNLIQVALDCERFGAQGITIHPRPDERHIRKDDVYRLKEVVITEFNIEGYPSDDFMRMVLEVKPDQVTLVPDLPGAITSDHGWDCVRNGDFLKGIINDLNENGIRTSVFLDPVLEQLEAAKEIGTHRIELYTESYASMFLADKVKAVADFKLASNKAQELGLGLNAGHDLNLDNLKYFATEITDLLEVSIGHALICDALYYGLQNTIQMYLHQLKLAQRALS